MTVRTVLHVTGVCCGLILNVPKWKRNPKIAIGFVNLENWSCVSNLYCCITVEQWNEQVHVLHCFDNDVDEVIDRELNSKINASAWTRLMVHKAALDLLTVILVQKLESGGLIWLTFYSTFFKKQLHHVKRHCFFCTFEVLF